MRMHLITKASTGSARPFDKLRASGRSDFDTSARTEFFHLLPTPLPFALSLSKGLLRKTQGFVRISPIPVHPEPVEGPAPHHTDMKGASDAV